MIKEQRNCNCDEIRDDECVQLRERKEGMANFPIST